MKNKKITALILAAMMTLTSLAACNFYESKPEGAIDITPEESAAITEMYESGMTTLDIAESLVESEETSESTDASVTEATTEGTTTSETEETVKPTESSHKTDDNKPTKAPTATPKPNNRKPTKAPTATPKPNNKPTKAPTATPKPTKAPTSTPKPTKAPTATPTPKPTPKPKHDFKTSVENECVKLINAARKAFAADQKREWYVPLKLTDSNRKRAHTRCDEIVKSFSHNSPSGNADWHENIHKGGGILSAKTIVNAWVKSKSHYANLIYCAAAKNFETLYCGVGVLEVGTEDGTVTYCVFGISGGDKGTPTASSGYKEPAKDPDSGDDD